MLKFWCKHEKDKEGLLTLSLLSHKFVLKKIKDKNSILNPNCLNKLMLCYSMYLALESSLAISSFASQAFPHNTNNTLADGNQTQLNPPKIWAYLETYIYKNHKKFKRKQKLKIGRFSCLADQQKPPPPSRDFPCEIFCWKCWHCIWSCIISTTNSVLFFCFNQNLLH